jgi:nucleotide-binding universal stress UspA family protein
VSIERLLLCVDGSPSALEAARLAIELALGWDSVVRAIFVVQHSEVAEAIDATALGHRGDAEHRLVVAAGDVLAHVERLGRSRGLAIETILRAGDPAHEILREARSLRPDIIVIGLAGRRGPGPTVIGSVTAELLEFAEWPVIVVPAPARDQRTTVGPAPRDRSS